mgnify:CR=1 FL=1
MGVEERDKVLVWAYIGADIREMVKVADAMGVSISEYVRKLILEDLDPSSLIASTIKDLSGAEGKKRRRLKEEL